jgi:hypothetical protein
MRFFLIWILFDFELFIVFRYMQGIPGFRKWLSGYPPLSTICHYREGKKKLKSQRWSQPAMSTRSCAIRGDNPKAIKRIYTYIPGLSVHDSFWPIFWGSEGMDGATASVAHITTLHPSGPVSTWLPRPWDPNDISHLYFTVVIYHMWIYNLCLYQWIYMHHLNPIHMWIMSISVITADYCPSRYPKAWSTLLVLGGTTFAGSKPQLPHNLPTLFLAEYPRWAVKCDINPQMALLHGVRYSPKSSRQNDIPVSMLFLKRVF